MKRDQQTTIVLLPIESISPRYRDSATTDFVPVGVPMLFLSPILGGPELTVPIGVAPYHSKISARLEHLPVAVSLLASPGTDLDLIAWTASFLRTSRRRMEVRAGNELFDDDVWPQCEASKMHDGEGRGTVVLTNNA